LYKVQNKRCDEAKYIVTYLLLLYGNCMVLLFSAPLPLQFTYLAVTACY